MNDTQTLRPITLVQSKPFSNISLQHYTSLCKQFFDKKNNGKSNRLKFETKAL